MRRLMISLSATAALVLWGTAFSLAQPTPLAPSIGILSQHHSPIAKIGCRHATDNCPYGKRIVRHRGHGTTCEPCEESKEDDSGKDKKKEESNEGRHPSGSSHYDEGRGDYDRQDQGYAHGDQGYDRRQEGYERDEGYDGRGGYQGREEGYDRRGYSHGDDAYGQQGYSRGDEGYYRGDQGYGDRGYGPSREGDYGPYYERPYGWQERDCQQFGPDWYCRQ
jgi:hypothetical protein